MDFQIVLDVDLPTNSFIVDGEKYDVPCVFQIWIKRPRIPKRTICLVKDNPLFYFCDKKDSYLAVRRVGGRAGQIIPIRGASESSTLFIKPKSGVDIKEVINVLEKCDFTKIRENTVGVRSISKYEINLCVMEVVNNGK
jgi:hypothetical protein